MKLASDIIRRPLITEKSMDLASNKRYCFEVEKSATKPEIAAAVEELFGVKVTLRGERMYEFMDKLFNFALPRVRDFKGINPNAFDGRGNYSLGLKEQLIFPEVEYDKVEKIRGMDIVFVTTAGTDEEAKELLALMGAPFSK